MTTEEAIARAAREILRGVQAQYPEVQMYQGEGLPPDLAVVILSPSGITRGVRYGVGSPDSLPIAGPHPLQEIARSGVIIETPLLTKGALPAQTSTTYAVDKMMDVRGAFLALILVDSTLDQALTIQAVGSYGEDPGAGRVSLGGSQSLAAGNTTMQRLGLAIVRRDYPYPFLGVTYATGGTPPTEGLLVVQGYVEKWPIQGVGL